MPRREVVRVHIATNKILVRCGHPRHRRVSGSGHSGHVQVDSHVLQLSALKFDDGAAVPWSQWLVRQVGELLVCPRPDTEPLSRVGENTHRYRLCHRAAKMESWPPAGTFKIAGR